MAYNPLVGKVTKGKRKMSKMSDLDIEVQEMINHGMNANHVADVLGIPIEWVIATETAMNGEDKAVDLYS